MKITTFSAVALLAVSLSGCIIAPMRPAYVAPVGVAYVGPTYAMPAPGYVWAYHANYGWGWHSPQYGWHRGWR
jgi:hypothetical protein